MTQDTPLLTHDDHATKPFFMQCFWRGVRRCALMLLLLCLVSIVALWAYPPLQRYVPVKAQDYARVVQRWLPPSPFVASAAPVISSRNSAPEQLRSEQPQIVQPIPAIAVAPVLLDTPEDSSATNVAVDTVSPLMHVNDSPPEIEEVIAPVVAPALIVESLDNPADDTHLEMSVDDAVLRSAIVSLSQQHAQLRRRVQLLWQVQSRLYAGLSYRVPLQALRNDLVQDRTPQAMRIWQILEHMPVADAGYGDAIPDHYHLLRSFHAMAPDLSPLLAAIARQQQPSEGGVISQFTQTVLSSVVSIRRSVEYAALYSDGDADSFGANMVTRLEMLLDAQSYDKALAYSEAIMQQLKRAGEDTSDVGFAFARWQQQLGNYVQARKTLDALFEQLLQEPAEMQSEVLSQ